MSHTSVELKSCYAGIAGLIFFKLSNTSSQSTVMDLACEHEFRRTLHTLQTTTYTSVQQPASRLGIASVSSVSREKPSTQKHSGY
jgi:hypothetical protein